MYKDKDKQAKAAKQAKARFKARKQGIPLNEGIPGIPPKSKQGIPHSIVTEINRQTTNKDGTIDEPARATRTANAKRYQQLYPDSRYTGAGAVVSNPVPVRVSKPGDAGYKPLCATTRAWCEARQ